MLISRLFLDKNRIVKNKTSEFSYMRVLIDTLKREESR